MNLNYTLFETLPIYRLLSFGKTTDIKEEKSIIATYYCKKNSVLLSLFLFYESNGDIKLIIP